MTKFYFRSLPLYTDSLFAKAVRGKSPNLYDCYFFLWSKALIDTEYFFSSVIVVFLLIFDTEYFFHR